MTECDGTCEQWRLDPCCGRERLRQGSVTQMFRGGFYNSELHQDKGKELTHTKKREEKKVEIVLDWIGLNEKFMPKR